MTLRPPAPADPSRAGFVARASHTRIEPAEPILILLSCRYGNCILPAVIVHFISRLARSVTGACSRNNTATRRLRLSILVVLCVAASLRAAPGEREGTPIEIVLVEAESVKPAAVMQWKGERFKAVAVV